LLAAASRSGIRVILDVSTYRNLLVNAGINPYKKNWKRFVRYVTSRRNTVTGRHYARDPTIAMVALAGEARPLKGGTNGPRVTPSQIMAFFRRTLRQWAQANAHHLVSPGGQLYLNPRTGIQWRKIFALRHNDVCSIHAYGERRKSSIRKVARYCARLTKPWITEEFGWKRSIGDLSRATRFRRMYRLQRSRNSAGAAFWNLGPEGRPTSFDVNQSAPLTLRVVRRSAPQTRR